MTLRQPARSGPLRLEAARKMKCGFTATAARSLSKPTARPRRSRRHCPKRRPPRTDDEVALAVFNSDTTLVAPFSHNRPQMERAIQDIRPGGGTAFYDAMSVSLHDVMAPVSGRKAIVVFTDGIDNQMQRRGSGS